LNPKVDMKQRDIVQQSEWSCQRSKAHPWLPPQYREDERIWTNIDPVKLPIPTYSSPAAIPQPIAPSCC
jgi:hypothetical protein